LSIVNKNQNLNEYNDIVKVGFAHWFKITKLIQNDLNSTQLKCILDFKVMHKEQDEETIKYLSIHTVKPGMLVSCVIKEHYGSGTIVNVGNLEGYILRDH